MVSESSLLWDSELLQKNICTYKILVNLRLNYWKPILLFEFVNYVMYTIEP